MAKVLEFLRNWKLKLGKWLWVISAVLLLIGWRVVASANKSTKVEVSQVSRGELVESVSTSGTIKADQHSVLTFPAGGKIVWVGVKAGDTVKKGQGIAQIDTIPLNAVYQQALNNYRNYEAAAANALDQVKDHSADETFAQKATRTAAEVARDNAFDAIKAAEDNLRNAVLTAPFAGIVDTVNPTSAGMIVLPGAANYTVVNPNSVYFDAEVDETDLPHIAVGQNVNIKLDAYPNDSYQGTVVSIGIVAFTSSTGGNAYHVRISLPDNSNMKFKVGMGGDVDIIFNKIEDVLKVPVSAVVTDTNNYVWEAVAGHAKKFTVETGGENNEEVEVKSGISEGQTVLSQPPALLKEGQRLQF